MSATTHRETHPDAEMLSAFAEQALSARERREVLGHLAICDRCRQIVALAREAEHEEVTPARHRTAQPRAWWRGWSLALAPIAAVVATAAIAIYVHERNVEKSAEVAQLKQQSPDEKPAMPSRATQQPQSPASAPVTTPHSAHAESHEKPRAAAKTRDHLIDPDEAAVPPPMPTNGPLAKHDEPMETSRFERHRANDDAVAPPGAAPYNTTPSESASRDAERKRQAEESLDRHFLAATAPTPGIDHPSGGSGAENGNPGDTEPASLSAEQPEMQPAPTVGSLQLHRLSTTAELAARPHVFRLPSKRPAVSIASGRRRMIAIDERGALFLSEDSGETWEKVKRQWSGHAVLVRRHPREMDTTKAASAPGSAGVISNQGTVSQSDTGFELVNDQSQVWVSEDGRIWTAE